MKWPQSFAFSLVLTVLLTGCAFLGGCGSKKTGFLPPRYTGGRAYALVEGQPTVRAFEVNGTTAALTLLTDVDMRPHWADTVAPNMVAFAHAGNDVVFLAQTSLAREVRGFRFDDATGALVPAGPQVPLLLTLDPGLLRYQGRLLYVFEGPAGGLGSRFEVFVHDPAADSLTRLAGSPFSFAEPEYWRDSIQVWGDDAYAVTRDAGGGLHVEHLALDTTAGTVSSRSQVALLTPAAPAPSAVDLIFHQGGLAAFTGRAASAHDVEFVQVDPATGSLTHASRFTDPAGVGTTYGSMASFYEYLYVAASPAGGARVRCLTLDGTGQLVESTESPSDFAGFVGLELQALPSKTLYMHRDSGAGWELFGAWINDGGGVNPGTTGGLTPQATSFAYPPGVTPGRIYRYGSLMLSGSGSSLWAFLHRTTGLEPVDGGTPYALPGAGTRVMPFVHLIP